MKNNLFRFQFLLVVTFTLLLTNFLSSIPQIYAQLTPVRDNILGGQINFRRVTASPFEGAPSGRGQGAGSQSGECQIEEQQTPKPLIALVPKETTTDGENTAVWGRTSQTNPTFWFYSAYPQNTYVLLELQDEEENILYETSVQLQSEEPGLVSVTLPSEQEAVLEAGKKYLWYFYVMCNQPNSPDDFVHGWVEVSSVNPEFTNKLEQATPIERIELYAENGFWYDALNELEKLRSQQPGNPQLNEIWTDLLKQVDIVEEVSKAPVVQRHLP